MIIRTAVFLIALAYAKAQKREGDTCVEKYTSTVGRCKPAESCESARNDFQLNGIRPTFCTYSAFGVTLVCCRDGVSILHTAEQNTPPPIWHSEPNRQSDTRRVSERKDKDVTSTKPPVDETSDSLDDTDHKDIIEIYRQKTPTIIIKKEIIKKEETPTNKEENPGENSSYSDKEIELISKIWGFKMRKLRSEQKRLAEKLINDILYYAEANQLNTDSLNMLQSTILCNNSKQKVLPLEKSSNVKEEVKEESEDESSNLNWKRIVYQ